MDNRDWWSYYEWYLQFGDNQKPNPLPFEMCISQEIGSLWPLQNLEAQLDVEAETWWESNEELFLYNIQAYFSQPAKFTCL